MKGEATHTVLETMKKVTLYFFSLFFVLIFLFFLQSGVKQGSKKWREGRGGDLVSRLKWRWNFALFPLTLPPSLFPCFFLLHSSFPKHRPYIWFHYTLLTLTAPITSPFAPAAFLPSDSGHDASSSILSLLIYISFVPETEEQNNTQLEDSLTSNKTKLADKHININLHGIV